MLKTDELCAFQNLIRDLLNGENTSLKNVRLKWAKQLVVKKNCLRWSKLNSLLRYEIVFYMTSIIFFWGRNLVLWGSQWTTEKIRQLSLLRNLMRKGVELLCTSLSFQVCRNPIVEEWQKIYVIVLTALFFVLPTIFLFALNCHLYRVLHFPREYEACIHENRRERRRKQNQVANIIASIVSIFFVCHLPFRVAVLWFTFEDKNKIWALGLERYLLLLYSVRIMFYLNHALNPVIYNFVSTKFRSALYEVYLSFRRFGFCSFFTRYKHGLRSSVVFSTRTIISKERQGSSDV